MPKDELQTIAELGDVPFDLDQLFYSRTDKRGVIAAGNSVFQKISGFDWNELIGAPHKLVRNHDTPRAVFRVMWDTLKRDEPVVAYVRNRTKGGRGYWVIATIFPLEDGYLSVRIKPTSSFFEKVKPIYAELSAAERLNGISVEESHDRLIKHIQALGFADYQAFAAHAIEQEFRIRTLARNPRLKGYFGDTERIREAMAKIFKLQSELLDTVALLRDLPTNMRIIASRLEPSGGPLSAMSDIYSATSSTLFAEINQFALGSNSVSKTVVDSFNKAIFAKTCSMLQDETEATSAKENLKGVNFDPLQEIQIMKELRLQLQAQDKSAMQMAQRFSNELNGASYNLRRSMLGLDTIRVMGLVESGRLGAEGSRIGATMEQIGKRHDSIIRLLQSIKDESAVVNSGIAGLSMHFMQKKAIAAG